MRKALMVALAPIAAFAIATLLARRLTKLGASAPMVEPRRAGAAALQRQDFPATRFAMISSLWTDRAGAQCRIGAVWADSPAQARFEPILRLSLRQPEPVRVQIPPREQLATRTWVARDQVMLSAANDAEIAQKYVAVEPGFVPVVRILRAASFRPRRATFGRTEAKAAA